MPQVLSAILSAKMEPGLLPPMPDWQREIHSRYGDYTARGSAGYWDEAAKSAPLWIGWREDYDALVMMQHMNAGANSGEGIPFHPWRGGRILLTKFVCSREVAEKIAFSCGAILPVPASQEELDALAKLLPNGTSCHSGLNARDKFGAVLRRDENMEETIAGQNEKVPEGTTATIFTSNERGVFRMDQGRALLVLEWPENEKRHAAFVEQWNKLERALPGHEKDAADAEKAVIEAAVKYRIVDENLPPAMQKAVKDAPPVPADETRTAPQQQEDYQNLVRAWEYFGALLRTTKEMHQKIDARLKKLEKQSTVNPDRRRVVFPP
jgi:hypothetical protein